MNSELQPERMNIIRNGQFMFGNDAVVEKRSSLSGRDDKEGTEEEPDE